MNKKLNKKLAEWAGFRRIPYQDCEDGKAWGYPDSSEWDYEWDLPNFTDSLDACFEWLVPKLEQKGYKYELCATTSPTQHRVAIRDRGFSLVGRLQWNDDPALAFCLAIEKLIDGEK